MNFTRQYQMMKNLYRPLIVLLLITGANACKTTAPLVDIESVEMDTIEINASSEKEIYRASEKRFHDLLHTKLEVSFDWDSAFLFGKANLTLSPYFYATDSLTLDAKGFQIHKIALVDAIGKTSPLNYTYDSLQLKIQLNKTYKKSDTFEILVDYTAMPNKLKEGGSAAITSDKGLYFINNDGSDPNKPKQIWTQGETEASSCWFPTIDSPNERTTQEIYITVDSVYETLSNGELIFQTENGDGSRTDYWKQELPHAPYLFMMAIGDFAIVKDEWKGKEVNYYVEHKYEAYAKDIYPNTPEMLSFFSDKLAYEYPWDKYNQVVVRDYVSGAMENTGAVIYGDFIQGDDRFLIDNSGEDIVAHELFHHWFGDLVTCESWSNLPLNESFATYGEYLWNEYKYGKDEADYKGDKDMKIYLQQSAINKKKLIRFQYENREDMFDTHSYQKGGRILHMLRNYVGDEAFFKALNLYLTSNEYSSVEIHQLRLAFEKVTGEDLNWFFNQWFMGAGHPIIQVEKEYIDSTETLEVNIIQTQEGEGIANAFVLPTTLGIVDANGKLIVKKIQIDQREQSFRFSFAAQPKLVNLDVEKILLGEINQAIDRSEGVTLFKSARSVIDRKNALKMLKNKKDSLSLDIVEAALEDPFWEVRRTAINTARGLAKSRKSETFTSLKRMAKNDEKSSVRSAALSALSQYYEDEVDMGLLKSGIKDKSYNVVAASLNAVYEKDAAEGAKLAEELEEEKNSTIRLTIARIYASEGDPKRQAFFESSLEKAKGFSKYPILSSYADYMAKQENSFVREHLPLLKEESMGDGFWIVRMAALNGVIKLKNNYEMEVEEYAGKIGKADDAAQKAKLELQRAEAEQILIEVKKALTEIDEKESNFNLKKILKGELE